MQKIYLIRHGETEWTLSGQHTGLTDISLTPNGKQQAHLLKKKLKDHSFQAVFVSPLKRAYETCQIAGFAEQALVDSRLMEWNYGDYEGRTSTQIHVDHPHWNIFNNGAPHGESVADIAERTKNILHSFQEFNNDIAVFSHGHFLRALAVSFIELEIEKGKHFSLFPGAVSILTKEKTVPTISLWNDISHLL